MSEEPYDKSGALFLKTNISPRERENVRIMLHRGTFGSLHPAPFSDVYTI